jgi:hypothetical protein
MERLAAMEAFVLVVDTGLFSAAARRLDVAQPAVSKLVAQLEDRLGVKTVGAHDTGTYTDGSGPKLLRTGGTTDQRFNAQLDQKLDHLPLLKKRDTV